MLTKRTNLLLDEEMHKNLMILSQEEGISMGEIIRRSLGEKLDGKDFYKMKKRAKAVSDIMDLWKKTARKGRKTDYKALIEHGRRF